MPYLMIFMVSMAISWWIGGRRKRREARQRTAGEIRHTLETGMPTPDTAVGRKAEEVAKAQAEKLRAPPPIHGTARWGTATDAKALIEGNQLRAVSGTRGLWLGDLIEGDTDTALPLVARYPGHLLTAADTGQGKSATQIVTNLLSYSGSVVVLDPKGELYDLTADARRRFGNVHRIAPYAKAGDPPSQHYNPLLELGDIRERPARARQLAEMLIVRHADKGAGEGAFWENEAVNLLTLLLLGVVEMSEVTKNPKDCTLAEVRRICARPLLGNRPERDPKIKDYFEDTLFLFAQQGKSALVRQQGMAFYGCERKTLSSFLSEINSNLAFFDGPFGGIERQRKRQSSPARRLR